MTNAEIEQRIEQLESLIAAQRSEQELAEAYGHDARAKHFRRELRRTLREARALAKAARRAGIRLALANLP